MALPGTALYWHRQDLRLIDNYALRAASEYSRLIVVYGYEPFESWPRGAASRWWLHHSLAALASQYEALGQRLHIIDARSGGTAKALAAIVASHDLTGVFWQRRYEPEAIARDTAIKAQLSAMVPRVETFGGALLKEPWQHNKDDGTPYKVYTPLWRRFRAQFDCPVPLPAPQQLPPPPANLASPDSSPGAVPLEQLALLPTRDWADGFQPMWQPGEAGGLRRLDAFVADRVGSYGRLRDFPALDHGSGLAPHLHFGEVSPRQIWVKALAHPLGEGERDEDREVFLSELVWREFATHLIYHYPDMVDQSWKEPFRAYPWRDVNELSVKTQLRAWQKGQTGVPIVDAAMRQLWHTGTMHNRVRMVVGSYLTKNLRIHWREGARWFWDTLLDADLAANSFNWQWVAGSGADAAPYFRIFNPIRQGERFDPEGAYVRKWVPEVAGLPDKHLHAPWLAPAAVLSKSGVRLGDSYPLPLVDLKASREAALDGYQAVKAQNA